MFRQDSYSLNQNCLQLRFGNFKFKSYFYRVDAQFLIFSLINDEYSSCNENSVTLHLSSIIDVVFNALRRLKLVYYSSNKILSEIELRRENRFSLQNFLECLKNSILLLPKHDNIQNELLDKLNFTQVISPVASTKITFHSPSNEKKIEWVNLTINDVFDFQLSPNISTNVNKSHSDSKQVVMAIRTAIEDFASVCEEFESNYACNSATVLFLRRDGLYTYAEMLKDRIIYDLSTYIAIDTLPTSSVDEELMGIIITLVIRIESLNQYSYLREPFITRIFENISSSLDLIRLYINSTINTLSNWIISILSTSPRQRGSQLSELNQLLKKFLTNIHITTQDTPILDILQMLKQDLVTKLIVTFCSHLETLKLEPLLEDEQSLLSHISACHACYEHVALLSIPSSPEDPSDVPSSSLQLLLNTCENSVSEALTILLNYKIPILNLITTKLFKETISSNNNNNSTNNNNNNNNNSSSSNNNDDILWIGGLACKQYIERFSDWKESFLDLIPIQFHPLLILQISKMMLIYYIQSLIRCYRNNKRMKLSQEGVVQVISDLASLDQWMTSQKIKSSSESQLSLMIQLIKTTRLFLSVPSDDILLCFSEAFQMFGVGSRLHLYDLLRVAMKVRSDLPTNTRKCSLSICSEFLSHIQLLLQSPEYSLRVFQGSDQSFTVMHQIFPLAGSEHCTGKKWSLETTTNLTSEAILSVHEIAQEACRISLIRVKAIKETLKETNEAAELQKLTIERNRIYRGIFDREPSSPSSNFSRLSSNESFIFNNEDSVSDSPSASGFAALHHALRPYTAYGHTCYMGEVEKDLDVSVFISEPSDEEEPKTPTEKEADAADLLALAANSNIKLINVNGRNRYQSVRFSRSMAPAPAATPSPTAIIENVRRPFNNRTLSTGNAVVTLDSFTDTVPMTGRTSRLSTKSSQISDVVRKRASSAFRFNSKEPSSPLTNIKPLANESSDSDSDVERK